ncbi:MAG: class I SAM-dependent methyltransferase [Minwuia sp.]|uniref:class I SAM-dependent methyltransferase n=1 Tax=Minwuia sp. TaxID=2493630 RepID=UPI003A8BD6F0
MAAASFKHRFKAWWEGYEIEPSDRRAETTERNTVRRTLKCRYEPDVEVSHLIFGEGRTLPMEADPLGGFAQPVENPFGMVTLLLGVETGAPVVELVQKYSVQLTALEPDRRRAAAGDQLLRDTPDLKPARIGPVDVANVELSPNKYHLVLARLILHRFDEREFLYRKFERALRRGGQFIPTQFLVADEKARDEVARQMKSTMEPDLPHLSSLAEEQRMLTELGLIPVLMEDLTERMLTQLTERFSVWKELVERIARYEQQPRMLQALLALVEHWQSRINLMKSGDLLVCRLQVEKRRNELN